MSEYGDSWADLYDDWFGNLTDTEPAIAVLTELADGRPALEIGPGTGRLTIPLAQTRIEVTAVESSPRMVQRLRAKLDGEPVRVIEGDAAVMRIADVAPAGGFGLAYLSCNTLFQLQDQQSQADCLVRVGESLAPDGALVVEASMPNIELLARGSKQRIEALSDGRVAFTESRADVATQRKNSMVVLFDQDGHRVLPVLERWVWPAELDLMARLAGLTLTARWSGWEGQPFDSRSTGHVSVYRPP